MLHCLHKHNRGNIVALAVPNEITLRIDHIASFCVSLWEHEQNGIGHHDINTQHTLSSILK